MTKTANAARGTGATVCFLFGVVLLGWAVLVFLVQCFAWLKTGLWQPIPIYAMFLPPALQTYMVGVIPPGSITPLALVPSFGSYDSLESLARSLAGSAEGVFRILAWLLEQALAGWLVALALGSFFVTAIIVADM